MRFFQTLFAGVALVAAALAVEINEFPSEVQPGRSYTITYTPGDDTPTTFILRKGKNEDLDTIGTLEEGVTGGTFTWDVSDDLPNGDDYALEIQQNGQSNYIGPIALTGSTASPSASVSSASSTGSASRSTTSAPSSLTTATSASGSVSASSNGTISSPTLSRTGSATTSPTGGSTPTESSGPPESTGAASSLASSPFALFFGAVAAMAYLN